MKKKKLTSIFILLMQSYGKFQPIPRNYAKYTSTCMDKRPIFGHIEEIGQNVVQTTPSTTPHSGATNTENRRFERM